MFYYKLELWPYCSERQAYLEQPSLETHPESSGLLVSLGKFGSHSLQSDQFTHIWQRN